MPVNICWPEVPLKLVVPPLVSVPLLVSVPAIFNVPATVMVREAPLLIVRLLQEALPPIAGILVAPEVMTTLVLAEGTVPEHQLSGFNQSVLVLPVHCPSLAVPLISVYAVAVHPAAVTCKVYKPAAATE